MPKTEQTGGGAERLARGLASRSFRESPASCEADRQAPEILTPQGACIRRAICQEDMLAAYRFIRKTRMSLGYPAPGPAVVWPDDAGCERPRDLATFVAKAWPGVVASTSLLLDSQHADLPADRVFPELTDLRGGRVIAQVDNRLARPEYYRTNVPNDLLRCCVAHGLFVGCTDLLAVARPWERGMLETLGFARVGEVRSCGGAVPEPVILVRLDLATLMAAGRHRTGATVESASQADVARLLRFYLTANPYVEYVRPWAGLVEQERQAGRIHIINESDIADDSLPSEEPTEVVCEPAPRSTPVAVGGDQAARRQEVPRKEKLESNMTAAMSKSGMHEAPAEASRRSSRAERIVRRVAWFQRAGLFAHKPTGFEVTRALTIEDHWQAYQLVHDCYLQRGYIDKYPGGARIRPFEAMPEMATFVAKVGDRVVAVTSVLMDSPELGLPSDRVFSDEIDQLRSQGRRVVEITNLAVHPDYRKTNVFSELTRCCLAHTMTIGYDDMFIAISPEHARFFKEVILFQPWGGKRDYSEKVKDIVVGMRLDLRTLRDRAIATDVILGEHAFLHDFYFARNTFHDHVRRWAIRAAGVFCNAELLRELFVKRSGLFDRLTPHQTAAIRQRWGEATYYQVMRSEADAQAPEDADLPAREGLSAA